MNVAGERVAVTGIGVVSALGVGASGTFARLLAGERGIAQVRRFDPTGFRSQIAAEVPELEVASHAPGKGMSRTDAFALVAAREALASAGLSPEPGSLGLVLGGTAGAMWETEEALLRFGSTEQSPRRASLLVESPLSSTVATLERALGPLKRGATTCSACSSGGVAIALGAHWVASGQVGAVLAGGADALCRMTFAGFNALGALDPEPCRPFDTSRRGLTLGEGAAFLLLEPESRARARNATVLAWLSGWAIGAEAHHATHPEPSGARPAALIRAALASAGLGPEDIDYVNAHGTGTLQNDAMEVAALRLAFGDQVSRIGVSSSKAQLGHALGAAGALEAALTVLALRAGAAPATAGLEQPEDPGVRHLRGEPWRGPLRAAVSNSFGFGGMDAVVVFEHRDAPRRDVRRTASSLVITGVGLVDFAAPDGLDPERSRRFDAVTSGVTRAAQAALTQAALPPEGVGLVVGNAYGNVERSLRFLDRLLFQGPRHTPPAEFPHLVHSAPAGHASIYLGLSGPVFSVCDGHLGAEGALAGAQALLESGLARAVVTGAAEAPDAIVQQLRPDSQGAPRSAGGAFVVLERRHAGEAVGRAALARLVAHVEERGQARSQEPLRAPEPGRSARVVFTSEAPALRERLEGTAFESVAGETVPNGGHEAVGALAIAHALSLLASRTADDVLIVSGDGDRRFLTRLSRVEEGS